MNLRFVTPPRAPGFHLSLEMDKSQSIYQAHRFDRCPDHLHWRVGSQLHSPLVQQGEFRLGFEYWMELDPSLPTLSFREEVFRALQNLYIKEGQPPIALSLSGGIDSEIIARGLHELGIPFRPYFLSFWDQNMDNFNEFIKPLETELGIKTEIIKAEKEDFFEVYAPQCFLEYGVEYPTYIALTYLFSQLPKDEFILVGEGDLDKQGPVYDKLSESSHSQSNGYVAYCTSEIIYRLWAQKNQRPGQYYFFNSTPELLLSAFRDPAFEANYPYLNTKEVVYRNFPEIRRRRKTNNWEGSTFSLNKLLRDNLHQIAKDHPRFQTWHPVVGTFQDWSILIPK